MVALSLMIQYITVVFVALNVEDIHEAVSEDWDDTYLDKLYG